MGELDYKIFQICFTANSFSRPSKYTFSNLFSISMMESDIHCSWQIRDHKPFLINFHFEDLSADASIIGAAEYFVGCDNTGINFRSINDLKYYF